MQPRLILFAQRYRNALKISSYDVYRMTVTYILSAVIDVKFQNAAVSRTSGEKSSMLFVTRFYF